MLKLRDYQLSSIDKLRQSFAKGHRATVLYLPTGGGKTECAISLLDHTKNKGNASCMIMDRRVLCDQTSKRLTKYGIDHGVLMAGHWRYQPEHKIQICTAQTLEARGTLPDMKVLVIDECHCSRKFVNEFVKNNPSIMVVGLSASPFTAGLGKTFSDVVSGATTKQLVDEGALVPLRVFIAKEIDMTGAKKVAGEWSDKEASTRGIQITGDIVTEWIKKTHELFGGPRKTIGFVSGVEHGNDLSRKFAEAGYNFISISYKDDDDYKQQVFEDFAREDTNIHGLLATDILTKGYDNAGVMICISARPFSKSFSSHVQQLGRVMRPNDGKDFSVWLDHSGNYLRFKKQWDDLYINGVASLDERNKTAKEPSTKEKDARKCPRCGALWPSQSDTCASCGHIHIGRNDIITKIGEMVELNPNAEVKEKFSQEYKANWYAQLLGYAKEKEHAEGSAWHQYKERFLVGPAGKKPEPIPPTQELRNWIISRAIARSKRK